MTTSTLASCVFTITLQSNHLLLPSPHVLYMRKCWNKCFYFLHFAAVSAFGNSSVSTSSLPLLSFRLSPFRRDDNDGGVNGESFVNLSKKLSPLTFCGVLFALNDSRDVHVKLCIWPRVTHLSTQVEIVV